MAVKGQIMGRRCIWPWERAGPGGEPKTNQRWSPALAGLGELVIVLLVARSIMQMAGELSSWREVRRAMSSTLTRNVQRPPKWITCRDVVFGVHDQQGRHGGRVADRVGHIHKERLDAWPMRGEEGRVGDEGMRTGIGTGTWPEAMRESRRRRPPLVLGDGADPAMTKASLWWHGIPQSIWYWSSDVWLQALVLWQRCRPIQSVKWRTSRDRHLLDRL